jgi:hypothetical protein
VLVDDGFVGNLQAAVDDAEGFAQLLLVNAERRIGVEAVPAHERVEAVLAEEAAEGGHLVGGAVEGRHRLARLAAANQFEDSEQADRPDFADGRVLVLQFLAELLHERTHLARILDQVVFFIDANGGECGGASYGMAVVGEATVEHLVLEVLRDVMAHADRPKRQIARGEALGHRNEVRHDLPVVDGEPLAGAAETGHHFIGDHQYAVLVAELAYALHVAVGWNENAVGAGDGLENEGCDGLRAFELDDFFDHRERLFSGIPAALDAVVRVEDSDDTGDARLGGPAARIAGERDAARGGAVVGAIARDDFVAAGEEAGDLDGVLVGFGAAVGKEKGVEVAGGNFGKLLAEACTRFGRHERIGVGEGLGLLVDGIDDALIAVANIDRHQLTVEVDEALACRRIEIDALGASDGDGVDLGLRGPLEQGVLFGEVDNFLAGHSGIHSSGSHNSPHSE